MQQDNLTLRRGRPDDAEDLARLHVTVWRATYGDYAPEQAIRLLDTARRLPYWVGALAGDSTGQAVWVVEEAGCILGVISIGPATEPAFKGRMEVKHLYVVETAQGKGLGQRLLTTALHACQNADARGMALAVVQQNDGARQFYRRMGGIEVDRFVDPGPLWRSENIMIAWDFA